MAVILSLCKRNLIEFVRNKTRLVLSLIFPFFLIYIFSGIFEVAGTGEIDATSIMLAGIVIATVFEFALRISSSTISDMLSGFMKEVLVSPVSRLSIALGQFLSSAIIATLQGYVILGVSFIFGFRISSPLTLLYMTIAMIFVGFVFAGFGLFIAANTRNMQTFQIVSMAITMPMMFLSGAYIPIQALPTVLEYIARFNPLTYTVIFFRAISLEQLGQPTEVLLAEGLAFNIGNFTITPWIAAGILAIFGALFLFLSTLAFTRADFSKMSRNAGDSIDEDL